MRKAIAEDLRIQMLQNLVQYSTLAQIKQTLIYIIVLYKLISLYQHVTITVLHMGIQEKPNYKSLMVPWKKTQYKDWA